ncbi:MAG: hypothetical protein Q7T18_05660 [Sedimentisphaerales bacterium]|nr:hypothetical protein [Sedimentisphaerales bacterium]
MYENWLLRQSQLERYAKLVTDAGEEQAAGGRCKNLLIKQLILNERIWTALRNSGVTDGDEFCFNFKFIAHTRSAGKSLQEFLCGRPDYDADVALEGLFRERWIVRGATPPMKASKSVVDQWVVGMMMAGFKHRCDFCGWWVWKYNLAQSGIFDSKKLSCDIIESRRGLIKSSRQVHSEEKYSQSPFKKTAM